PRRGPGLASWQGRVIRAFAGPISRTSSRRGLAIGLPGRKRVVYLLQPGRLNRILCGIAATAGGRTMATATRPYSVLITDDDPSCRQAMREIIEPEGFRTLLAGSGQEALDIVRDQSVHVALMDMHLPRPS